MEKKKDCDGGEGKGRKRVCFQEKKSGEARHQAQEKYWVGEEKRKRVRTVFEITDKKNKPHIFTLKKSDIYL